MTEVRRSVSIASRVLGIESHGDLIWGHVSIRDDDSRGVWMKRSGIDAAIERFTSVEVGGAG
jgi:hypothetical protein